MDKKYIARKTYGKTLGGGVGIPVISLLPKSGNVIINIFQLPGTTSITPLYFGYKRYELTDWLGNVRVVINDKKTPVNTGTTTVSYFPQIINVRDYYSYGSSINERTYSVVKYKYGFNDKENLDEVYGSGNFQDYGARMYDTRLGRFISADPLIVKQKQYAWLSSYQFASNTPIRAIDKDGLEAAYKNEQGLWTTAGDNLQHKPTAKEVEMMQKSYHIGAAPKSNYLAAFGAAASGASLGLFTGGAALLIAGIGLESTAALGLGVSMLEGAEVLSRASDVVEVVDVMWDKGLVEGGKVAFEKFIFIGLGKGKDYLSKKVASSKYEEELMKVMGEGYVKTSEYIYNKFKEKNQNNTETKKDITKKQTNVSQNKNTNEKDKNNKINSKKNISKPMYN